MAIINENTKNGNWMAELQRLHKRKDPTYITDAELAEQMRKQQDAKDKPEDKAT
jgi:hypothetical protein